MSNLRIGIMGYGHIGRGVEKAVIAAPDMELAGIFTRRSPKSVKTSSSSSPVMTIDSAISMKDAIDVMILCGSSSADLPTQGPLFAKDFNIVDSFDTHQRIPAYLAEVDAAATRTAAVISAGWDPGLFSIMRALFGASLPEGGDYTFWGRGVSQGHSAVVRKIPGVKNAVQYSIPVDEAVRLARSGENPSLTTRQKHRRECFVVTEEGADTARIARDIKAVPYYFADYDTDVHFISEEELSVRHSAMPHGGLVLRTGHTGSEKHRMEFSLTLDSNPDFTGSVMVACARAAARLAREGSFGAKTLLDIPLSYLSPKDRDMLIAETL